MKQTAVEWLEQQLFNKQGKFNKQDIEAAKEMHKEDCLSFAEQYEKKCYTENIDSMEKLYDEIYKK